VGILTRADLGGLGPSEGALVTGAIPANLSGSLRGGFPGVQPDGTAPLPFSPATTARTGNSDATWWVFALILCLAIFLVSRLRSNDSR